MNGDGLPYRIREWWNSKFPTKEEADVRSAYCLKERRTTLHTYESVYDIAGVEWYIDYTCTVCGMKFGIGKKDALNKYEKVDMK